MIVTVLHNVNRTTKTCRFEAPHLSVQMIDGGIHVTLADDPDGPRTGFAMFTDGGIVALGGTAREQYGPLAKPTAVTAPTNATT